MRPIVWIGAGIVAGFFGRMMLQGSHRIQKKIHLNVPVRTAYNQWTQVEEFPRCMSAVEEVRQEGDTPLFWRASGIGKTLVGAPDFHFAGFFASEPAERSGNHFAQCIIELTTGIEFPGA